MVRIVQEAEWASESVRTGAEILAPTGIKSPDRQARSKSLYQWVIPARIYAYIFMQFIPTVCWQTLSEITFKFTGLPTELEKSSVM